MRGSIQDANILSGLRPLDMIAYLRAAHWQEAQKLDRGAFWVKGDHEILLPPGTLVREGRSWVLKNPRQIRLLEGELYWSKNFATPSIQSVPVH